MTEIHIKVDDGYMIPLMAQLGMYRTKDVFTEALTILNWAAKEKKRGRIILSSDPGLKKINTLIMTSLENVVVKE